MRIDPLWEIRGKRSVVSCTLQVDARGTELVVMYEGAIAIREVYADEKEARAKAQILRDRLVARGWQIAS